MGRLILGLFIGLISGVVLTYLIVIGAPQRSSEPPGVIVRAPDPGGVPPGAAQVVLRQDFFNSVLSTIFTQMRPPTFPLGGQTQPEPATEQSCASRITITRQGSGAETGVTFVNNTLAAPMAFTGSYNSAFGCLQFSGWAQTRMDLRFDQATQSVFGQATVETVNLDGVNPVFSSLLTPIVQSTLNTRVNPIRIIDGNQVAVNMPIIASNGNLRAAVSDVRAEVKENALNLFIIYEFSGAPLALQQPAP
ncbi:MAG: hypothetical protein LC734_10620 [Acidobacteria bacterium]|nr:hypothetical protein [Acidobacteriota bacterium]